MGIIESVQQYDLNIPAGGSQAIDVQGDRVQFISAVDPFAQIELRPNFAQGNITLKPGQGFRFSQPVTRWIVFNRGTVPLSGYLLIGSGDFFDQRISGDVNVIDNGRSRTLSAMVGSVTATQPAVAANYSKAGIWNPAGSGRRVIVKRIYVGSSVAQVLYQARISTPLTTQGTPPSMLVDGNAFSGVSKTTLEATASQAGGGNVAAVQGSLFVSAAQGTQLQYDEPMVIRPGFGMVFVCSQANADLTIMMPFFEEAE